MIYTSESFEKVVDLFSSLPSIGRKTAQRLTFFILRQPKEFIEQFSSALVLLKDNVHFCQECFNYTETEPCPICSSNKRNKRIICVVEGPTDVMAIEKTGEYFGLYHVLHGALNPLDGITPDDLKVKELLTRIHDVEEIILALNPSVEGEVTTLYLSKLIKPLGVKITRIARGLPIGAEIEFADEATISRAIESRIEI